MYDKMVDGGYTCLDRALPGPMEPHERVRVVGEDCFVWASDFPHIDAEYGVLAELEDSPTGMSDTAVRELLGAGAASICKLPQTQRPLPSD